MNETRTLVQYCHTIGHQPLPKEIDEYARPLATRLPGRGRGGRGNGRIESDGNGRLRGGMGGVPEASAFGLDEKIPAAMAAFANGITEHSIEMDDTHSAASSHPGVVIWSAALALAEREGLTGAELLPATAAGYEMAAAPDTQGRLQVCMWRLSSDIDERRIRRCSDRRVPPEFVGGADAQCGGDRGSFASGNMEYLAQGTLTKRVQPGQAAHAGILSALLAQQGYTGPGTILEGEFGFLHAYSDSPVVGRLTADLGATW